MEKLENKKLKKYIIKFAASNLEKNKIFISIYGKGFIKEKIKQNLEKAYFGNFDSNGKGSYNVNDKSITINNSEIGGRILEYDDIKNNKDIHDTILHEAIHAIFAKTKVECKKENILSGTGLSVKYENNMSIGKGLNEGLTNWICNKCGRDMKSYPELTRFIELLELAIGERRVMRLAKGDLERNVINRLQMTEDELIELIGKTDQVYFSSKKVRKMQYILQVLKAYTVRGEAGEEEKKQIEEEYKRLKENNVYKACLDSKEYKTFVEENKIAGSIAPQIVYFNKKIQSERKIEEECINGTQELIFNKYFKRQIENAEKMEQIPKETIQMIRRLHSLLNIRNPEKYKNLEVVKFYNQYSMLHETEEEPHKNNNLIIPEKNIFVKIIQSIKRKISRNKNIRNNKRRNVVRKNNNSIRDSRGEKVASNNNSTNNDSRSNNIDEELDDVIKFKESLTDMSRYGNNRTENANKNANRKINYKNKEQDEKEC